MDSTHGHLGLQKLLEVAGRARRLRAGPAEVAGRARRGCRPGPAEVAGPGLQRLPVLAIGSRNSIILKINSKNILNINS
jgi:hypothetical protein